MDLKVVGDQLIMSGRIDGSELAKLRDVEAAPGSAAIRVVILRDSPGGDIWTALRVAERIRDNGWATALSGYCWSACTLLYLGGVSRHFTDDKPAGLTQIAFHGAYSREDGLRTIKDALNPAAAYPMRRWVKERTGGKMSDALLDRFLDIERKAGLLHLFDSRRLRRKDGITAFFCTGEEDPKKNRWEQCEKLHGVDVYQVGVATSPDVLRSNDLPAPNLAAPATDTAARLRPTPNASPTELEITTDDHVFPEHQARFGSFSSKEHCATVPNGLWVHPEEEKSGECIRYYSAGAKPGASRELVLFFSGDDLNRDRSLGSTESYARLTPNRMQADVERTGKGFGMAFVWVARPGVRGSSGDQLLKTRFREMRPMNGAVSRLKEIYGVETFHAYGQSGGGAVLEALLNMRTDIGCAAISSGNIDVDKWLSEQSGDRRGSATDWYNPKTYINANTLRARIVVLSDPRDKAVSFGSQRSYARALEAAGARSVHVVAAGPAPLYHSLQGQGVRALQRCLKGASLEAIRAELDQPEMRALVPGEPAPTPKSPEK